MDTVSILDGNQFVVSDRRGDVEATPTSTEGLFIDDTRFLSRWVLTINGIRPTVLSVDDLDYFRVKFFMALATGTIYVDSHLSVIRQRAVGRGFHEDLVLVNHGHEAMDLAVRVEAEADFADLFEVKDKLAKKGELYRHRHDGELTLGYRRERFVRETRISASEPAQFEDGALLFQVHLEPHAQWSTCLDVAAQRRPGQQAEQVKYGHGAREPRPELGHGLERWVADAPRLVSSWSPLELTYRRSLVDLAALRFRPEIVPGALPAAGLPWFMAMFGRDSVITSLQALPFTPELAATTLRMLALFQGQVDDAFRDEEPGKILHELRLGEMTAFEDRPHSPYYGAADSTTLFLILLDEYERWSGDQALVHELEGAARVALLVLERLDDVGIRRILGEVGG